MLPLDESARRNVRRLARGGQAPLVRAAEIFSRSHLGRLEAVRRPPLLPRRLRTLLLLVDGRASVGDLRRGLSRYRSLDEGLDMLRKMGLIEPLPAPLGS
jgi:DNA-binding transcriptional ArsR family regulator